jgi:hypothetical protein
MSATFVVNGVEKKLRMIDEDSSTDCAADFVGNTAHGMEHDDEGRYIATPEEFEWWKNTIAAHESMAELIEQYRAKYGSDTVDDHLQRMAAFDVDLEDQPGSVATALADLDE